jgi:hypothetical protein
MEWSEFTKNNMKYFTKKIIKDDNKLLQYLEIEKKHILNFIKTSNIKINIKKINDNLNREIYEHGNTAWVSNDFFNNINELDKTYKITWNKNKILIKTKNTNFLSRIKILIMIIEYLRDKHKIKKNITIYLILTLMEKKFPNNNEIISPHNINSGYTYFDKNLIFIWRLEEFEKVLLHEVIHCFDLDYRNHKCNLLININGPHSYFEAITDYQAITWYIIYLSIITNEPIKKFLQAELLFIKNQAILLYNFFKLNETNYINQKSPAYSYYILKYYIFQKFLNNMPKTIINYDLFLNDIIKKIKTKKYIDTGSARMTLLQLK